MKNMGIVTKVALTFFLINHTAIANRASAASNWLADPNSGHSVENPPDCNNKTDSTTTIPVEKYLSVEMVLAAGPLISSKYSCRVNLAKCVQVSMVVSAKADTVKATN